MYSNQNINVMCRQGMLKTVAETLVLNRFTEIRDIILWIEKRLECKVIEYTQQTPTDEDVKHLDSFFTFDLKHPDYEYMYIDVYYLIDRGSKYVITEISLNFE